LTREEVVLLMKVHNVKESDIDMVAVQLAQGALADLNELTFRHEIRREAILREIERRREGRPAQRRAEVPGRANGKARAQTAIEHLPEEPSPALGEPPS
jgi:hypothetical protein